jgi:flagellar hook protein FlgE
MSSVGAIARSGLDAARLQLDAAAGGVAHALSGASGRRGSEQVGTEARIEQARNVDARSLASDLVTQKSALYAIKANLRTLQTQDKMIGTLLDLRA